MEKSKHNPDEKGFTLIEVLIAMVIFATGILAVAQMQIRSLHANSDAFAQTEATMWASNQAEFLIAQPYTALVPNVSPYPQSGIPLTPDPDNKYALTWVITQVTNARSIAITVQWTQKGTLKAPLTFNYIKGQPI